MRKPGAASLALLPILLAVACGDGQEQSPPEGQTIPTAATASASVDAAALDAAKAGLLRLTRFRAADAPPVEAVYARRATNGDLDDVIGVGGTDESIPDVTGYLVAVDGAFQVASPPDADGTFTATPYTHAYILVGPGGDELAVHVTDETIDLTGFDRMPLP